MRQAAKSTAPYTEKWGYSRAVRIGNRIEVAGTSATRDDGSVHAPGDPYEQTLYIIRVMQAAVERLGGSISDTVRTRAYLVNVDDWQEVGRAHREVFGEIAPASTCIAGIELLKPDLLVELELTAVVGESAAGDA